jgi:broad specificity phosphatase PhoE
VPRTGHEVVLVRHGETEWTLSGQHTGSTDIPLTDEGRKVAERLGERLRDRSFALALSSPLGRSLETALLAGFEQGALQVTDDLREWDYGEYEGITTAQIREHWPGWLLWRDGAPGGEDAAAVGARADRVIERLHAAEDNAIVFSHGHMLRVLAARWVGLAPEHGALLGLETATLSVLGWERETAVIWTWNASQA